MEQFKLIVFTDPVPGKEEEYNDWYNNVHLQDVVAVPGVVAARRFKMKSVVGGEMKNRYLAIYDMETDDPEKVMEIIGHRVGSGGMAVTDTLGAANINVAIFEPCSEEVCAPN